jgi:hypothetical protein
MKYTGKEIVSRIRTHVKRRGGTSASWFIGVSAQPRQMLFETHAVRKKGDYWILARAKSSSVARKVKLFLATKVGMTLISKPMGKADFVYAYRKVARTSP